MNKVKITKTIILYKELEKVITIKVNDKEIKVNKWIKTDNIESDYDSNWKFNSNHDQEIYDILTDEEKDLVNDAICGIEI